MWWRPPKSIKLNKSQKCCLKASVRLDFNLSNFFPLFHKPPLLPSQPVVSGTQYHPENMRKEPGSRNTIPVETSQILYFPRKPASPFLGPACSFEGLRLLQPPLLSKAMKLLFLFIPKLCLHITYLGSGAQRSVFRQYDHKDSQNILSLLCKQLVTRPMQYLG